MKRMFLSVLAVCMAFLCARATNYFVSPTGTATGAGSGTISTPWSLPYALGGAGGAVVPGDVISLRVGTYSKVGGFTCTLVGTALQPIVVKNYNNERATIDGTVSGSNASSIIYAGSSSAYVWFMGLEVTSSSLLRQSALGSASSGSDIGGTSAGFQIEGNYIRVINCIIHDVVGLGVFLSKGALSSQIYGCLIYNNGFQSSDRGSGPGIYAQNTDPAFPKKFTNNFVFKNYWLGFELKAIGSFGSSATNGMSVDSNTAFNTGAPTATTNARKYNLAVGSDGGSNNPATNINVKDNVFYRDATDGLTSWMVNGVSKPVYYGKFNVAVGLANTDHDVLFNRNHFIGASWYGGLYVQNQFTTLDIQNNTFYSPETGTSATLVRLASSSITLPGTWNNNLYFGGQASSAFNATTFATWKTTYSVDAASTYNATAKPANYALVSPNTYDASTYSVSVLNHTLGTSYALAFNKPALNGYTYQVIDAQNYYGGAVATGTYLSGSPVINLPMNLTAVAAAVGNAPTPLQHTNAGLGTFIIRFTAPAQTCSVPTALASGSITSTAATVSWTAVTGAVTYDLLYKKSSDTIFTTVAGVSGLSYNLTGLNAATTYNFKVKTNCSASSSAYSTVVNFTTLAASNCTDAYEANNSSSTAAAITPNAAITALISTAIDVDYFKFDNSNTAKNIVVTLTNLPADYDITLYAPSGSQIGISQNTGTASESISYNPAFTGTFRVKVTGKSGAFNTGSCYTLFAKTSSTAGVMLGPSIDAVTLAPGADAVSIYPQPASGVANLKFSGRWTGVTNVTVLNQQGVAVSSQKINAESGNGKLNISSLKPGIYNLKVSNGNRFLTQKLIVHN